MQDERSKKIELEKLALNLDYSFTHGVDLQNRIIRLTEDIEEHHFDWFDAALTGLESLSKKRVTLRISSYGGDVYSALGIIGRMQKSKCLIDTEGYGKIMSAATIILASGHRRKMSEFSEFMHHEASYYVEGRHSEIQHEVKQSQSLSEKWCAIMSTLTGIPKQFWLQKGVGNDFYMSPEQCLNMNIIDEIF